MPSYTTTDLIASIKSRAQIPSSQLTFQSTDLLRFGDEEIRVGLLHPILARREAFYETVQDTPLLAGINSYSIPARAIGFKLKDIGWLDNAGNFNSLRQIASEDLDQYNNVKSDTPFAFYLQGNNVCVVPTPQTTSGCQLRLRYFSRPNNLVPTTSAAQISSISGNQIVVSSIPSSWTVNSTLDLIKANPGFECLAMDQGLSGLSGTTLTFSNTVPTSLAKNDWVALAGESPIAQLPLELHPVLAQRVAIRVLGALGHSTEAKKLEDALYGDGTPRNPGMQSAALDLLAPRVEGEPKKIVARVGVLNPQAGFNWLTRY